MKDSEKLREKVNKEFQEIKNTFGGPAYWAIHNIIRRMDVIYPFYKSDNSKEQEKIDEIKVYFNYGWSVLLKKY